MKKMYICFVLICVAVLIASIAFADDHTHIWDVNYTYSYRYTDEGDAHHRIQIRKRACIVDGCSQYWTEETGVIYVEGLPTTAIIVAVWEAAIIYIHSNVWNVCMQLRVMDRAMGLLVK